MVKHTFETVEITGEEWTDYQKLKATAPELLAALQDALTWIRKYNSSQVSLDKVELETCWKIDAAIVKATGGGD